MVYTGDSLKTYNKVHASGNTSKSYIVNKLYTMENGKKYFVNSKGFLHVLMIEKIRYNGKYRYYIVDNMLTKENTLKRVSVLSDYHTNINEAMNDLANFGG